MSDKKSACPPKWYERASEEDREFLSDGVAFGACVNEPEPSETKTREQLEDEHANLVMLVRRLCRRIGHQDKIAAQAADYLRRKGMDGSPLR